MKKAIEREKVGLMLASGYTKKEIAVILNKSIHTISMQARRLFELSGSHNLADLTRFVIKRYSGIPVEDILINALHDLTLIVFGAFLFYVFTQPSAQTEISGIFDSLIHVLKNQFQDWFILEPGTF